MRTAAALTALIAAIVTGCGVNHAGDDDVNPGDRGAPADTLRGVITITGADPLTRVELRPDGGSPVAIMGPVADTLRRATGLEVRVAGRLERGALQASGFAVRALDGVPAANGRLALDGDAVTLVTANGTVLRYPRAPAALRALAGRHVWIAGQPGAEPQQWGVLEP